MNCSFQIFSFILTGMWDEMGSTTLEISHATGQLADALQMNWQNFPSPVVKNVATYLRCYFQHPVSPGPVLEESLPAVVVLVEHTASLGPVLEESLLVVVVLNCWTVDVDGPYVEGVDRLDTSYKGRSVGRVSSWDASISDAIGIFSPCGTAVVWPFRFGVVFCLFDVEIVCWNPFFGGFRSLFGGFILFGSWMALILFWFLLNIFVRTPLSTEQPGQSEG